MAPPNLIYRDSSSLPQIPPYSSTSGPNKITVMVSLHLSPLCLLHFLMRIPKAADTEILGDFFFMDLIHESFIYYYLQSRLGFMI